MLVCHPFLIITMAIKTTGLSGELGRVGFILNIIFTVIAVVAVGLRVWAMILIKRSTEAHDFFVFGALVSLGFRQIK